MKANEIAEKAVITAEQLVAMFTLDAPVPVRALYGLYGSRTTFHFWKQRGLDVKHIEGMGPTVIPSKLRAFLLELRGDPAPMVQPESTRARAQRKRK